MPTILSLVQQLRSDYPAIDFSTDDHFSWSPTTNIVTYAPSGNPAELLHEVAHALLHHNTYMRDVSLLRMEHQAWNYARTALSTVYDVMIDDECIEDHLDTYRDWLHKRSTCPTCRANGYQIAVSTYSCSACTTRWRVNEARLCELRRYKIHS